MGLIITEFVFINMNIEILHCMYLQKGHFYKAYITLDFHKVQT